MGLCYWDVKMLWEARVDGARFDTTLTIGRQALNLHPAEVDEFRRRHARAFPGASGILRGYRFYDFADSFLHEALDVRQLEVMDYSSYEGATLLHDLNQPVPAALHERFDAVIDGGALEHVFNFPVAIANLMNVTRPGGRVFLFLPANNLCGHGFYQFSPELMFRVFTAENGFATERVLVWEAGYPGVEATAARTAYEVADPQQVRSRVGLQTKGPVIMCVQARKLATVPLFAAPPLQSDYTALWEDTANAAAPSSSPPPQPPQPRPGVLTRCARALPLALKLRIKAILLRRAFSLGNRAFYRPRRPGRGP